MPDIGRLLKLDDKVAIVTGGARGIGRAVADLFTEAGARVALCDLDGGGDAPEGGRRFGFDVSDEAAVEQAFADIGHAFGRIDILVHVAAIFPKRAFETMRAADWDAMQAVNARGTFLVMREAVKAMRASGNGGAIVNVSSVSGERAVVFHNSAYGASKAVVTNLTRSVAIEVAEAGIRVNAVLPGGVATEGARAATEQMAGEGLTLGGPMLGPGRMPLGRIAEPREIASACLFLASPAASYITGQTLAVDGGFLVS